MNNTRVLVVDDDQDLLVFYRVLLRPLQPKGRSHLEAFVNAPVRDAPPRPVFAVDTVDQGQDAILLVQKSVVENQPYAIAFVDMRMPPGIDGLETARRIRAVDDRITIVIVTAFSDRSLDEIHNMLQHDILFIRKPVTHDEILQHARNACIAWDEKNQERVEQQTLRKRIDSLDLNSTYLLDIISSLSEGVILCRPNREILFLNHAAVRMAGGRVDPWLNRPVDPLFPKADVRAFFEAIIEYNEKPDHLPWVMANTTAEPERAVLVSGSVLTTSYGNVHSVLMVINDLDLLRKPMQSSGQ